MKLTARINKPARAGRNSPALYLVQNEKGLIVGMLEKYPNCPGEIHPWKAFVGTGTTTLFIGAFYSDRVYQVLPDRGGAKPGGQRGAIEAVRKYLEEVGDLLPTG